jgi:hypothetical protein
MDMSNFLEKTLEDIIMSNLDKMPSKGLDVFYKNTVNQIPFDTKIADIFTWEEIDDVLYCRIIELKKDCVDEAAIWQIFNYKIDLFLFIFKKNPYIKDIKIELNKKATFIIILFGDETDVMDIEMTEAEYAIWSADDNYVIEFIKQKLLE